MSYGGMVQCRKFVNTCDTEFERVLEFAGAFAEQRFPGSVPLNDHGGVDWANALTDEVSKVVLMLTTDDDERVQYDSNQHTDKLGHDEDTGYVTMGSRYNLKLTWRNDFADMCHYFCVTVCPGTPFTCNINSHTFHVVPSGIDDGSRESSSYPLPPHLFITQKSPIDIQGKHKGQTTSQVNSTQHQTDQSDLELSETGEHQSSHESCMVSLNKQGASKAMEIKLMTYNIWNTESNTDCDFGYVTRMENMKKVLQDASPDIIGFQEVRYQEANGGDLGPNQVQTLADMLPGYQFVYQPAQVQSRTLRTGRCEEGVAIFSKYPILSQDYVLLEINKSIRGDQAVCLHGEIVTPDCGKLHVFTTHLTPHSQEAREVSVRQIWKYMKQFPGPSVFMGDLNAHPEEKSMQFLKGQSVFPQQEDRPPLKDAWLEMNPGDSKGFTFQCNASADDLLERRDYIYLWPYEGCQIVECHVVDNGNRGCDAASDHLPFQATLGLPYH